MRISTLALLGLGLGLSVAACRGGDGDDTNVDPDAPPPMDMGPNPDVRIQEIQSPNMPKGTAVSVKGVVVTAIDSFGGRTGDFFVQEPGGGEFSGVKVFGAPLDQVAMLAPGDLIDITGAEKDEFALSSDMSGRKVTELLLEAGEEVRALVRSPEKLAELDALGAKTVAGDVRDADYLASTFSGADAVYTLTAFDPTLPGYHADQDRRGEAIASAIRQSGVRHVVALSAIGGELASGNGFIASLHRQERRLRR